MQIQFTIIYEAVSKMRTRRYKENENQTNKMDEKYR